MPKFVKTFFLYLSWITFNLVFFYIYHYYNGLGFSIVTLFFSVVIITNTLLILNMFKNRLIRFFIHCTMFIEYVPGKSRLHIYS